MMPITKLMLPPLAILTLVLSFSTQAQEAKEFCITPDRMHNLFNQMKNHHPKLTEEGYFLSVTMYRLSSAKIGKNLYNQVLEITFTDREDQEFIAITQHKTASEECKMLTTELRSFIGGGQ